MTGWLIPRHERWDKADLMMYYFTSGHFLQAINVPVEALRCDSNCDCANRQACINSYYDSIVTALKTATINCVPKIPRKCLKPFWCDELDKLKAISIDMHNLWRSVGSPRQGVIDAARLNAKLVYKQAIKKAAKDFECNNADEIGRHLSNKDSTSFWKSWNAIYNNKPTVSNPIGGKSDPVSIANCFRDHYANIYTDSSTNATFVSEFKMAYNEAYCGDLNSENCTAVDIETIEECIKSLKCNKAAGHDGVRAEHILHAHPAVVLHLKLLFTMIITHRFIPDAFGSGIIIPILKDKCGDVTSVENYRPVTLSCVISKVLELVLLQKCSHFMKSDNLQFGFKQGVGCTTAIFALSQAVEYFNKRRSNVFIASLDVSKAFDRVNHYKLFTTLIRTGLPRVFVDLMVDWYEKLYVAVKWNGGMSVPLNVRSGVRQGSVLSPSLFNVYVNCFVTSLRESKLGCHKTLGAKNSVQKKSGEAKKVLWSISGLYYVCR